MLFFKNGKSIYIVVNQRYYDSLTGVIFLLHYLLKYWMLAEGVKTQLITN